MRKCLNLLCASTALTLAAATAQAATLNITDVTATWSSWTDGSDVTSADNAGTAELRWGTTSEAQSGYDFDPLSPSGPHAQDTDFKIGTFTHHNFPIGAGSGISSATLDVSFTFYLGADPGTSYTRTSQFVFDHFETPNNDNPCANTLPNNDPSNTGGCSDRVTPTTNPATSETFTITDGTGSTFTYVFDVEGFDIGDSFWTLEGQSNTADLLARFTYEENIAPVPLPAAAWFLIAGLGGLAAAGRRRRS